MALNIGEASSSTSRYSSSSSPRLSTYHVFLSFRGEDTRNGFTGHLCAALERKGITTFRDDKDLERGQVISQELLKAIEESMFAITILSQDYASSTWCLDELQKIMECNNNLDLEVLPVFYGVDPSDVRHQRGSYKKAFRKHKERFGQDRDRVKKWRDALKQVASHSGWDSKNQHEAELVEIIAQHIHKKLVPKLPSCTENLVGIASRVEEVNKLIGMGLNDVRFIGIWGMGGLGKTTIARAVFEAIRDEFEVTCFLANVREDSEKNGLVHLQRELLSRLGISKNDFHDSYDGKKTILNSLCRKKFLLVLDDVNEVNQLENLAGKQDWFGPGSRVIITTRDMHMLITHGIHRTYEVGKLSQNEAINLFCLKAFKENQPPKEYLDLSAEVVDYSDGLPLALEVLGSHLYGRNIDVWHSAVEKLRSAPHREIKDKLIISYEGLDSMEKNIFLDIACFFKGMKRNKVIDVLKNCGYFPQIGIEILVERSLITLDSKSNIVGMHDLLQQMGRDIVFQESPNDPSKRSRLWSIEDIDYVLRNNKGTEKINGICMNVHLLQQDEDEDEDEYEDEDEDEYEYEDADEECYEARWSPEAFSNMSQLKFLSLSRMQLPLGLSCLPCSLKVLHWRDCPLKTLPLRNQLDEVVYIDLSGSNIKQLWRGKQFMENLKYLDLSYSVNLKRFPDISGAPNLEKLILNGCTSLTEIHPSLVHHKKVVLLNLKDCESLKSLPGKLEMSSLKILNISYCYRMYRLPDGLKELNCLEELHAKDTAIDELPSYIFDLNNLKVLTFFECRRPLTYSTLDAFIKHKEKFGQHSEWVEKWRDSLTQVASHPGWDSKDQENLTGITSRVEEVNKLIGMGLNDVRFIGIWGMGGLGKTTTARAVYESIQGEFEVTCFLADVREVSETNGLVHIQRELLSRLSISNNDFHNLYDGKKTILNSLCRKKVLLVLDDVNEVNQLENLVGKQDWFGPGSRVIITTRDKRVLTTHGIDKIYEVVKLSQNEALNLFCLKAFKGNQPQEGYLDLSAEVVDYCCGLPLALEVLGSYLSGINIDVWHSAIKKLTSVPHPEIKDKLIISYEDLDSMQKNIFLDIACFFKGMEIDEVIDILESCGYSAQIVIDALVERSLITLESWEYMPETLLVGMHDLLQQMGRDIVFQESPNDPSRRSMLWSREDIDYVLTNNKGTEKINSISMNSYQPYEAYRIYEAMRSTKYEAHWSPEAFSNMSQLKFLSLCIMQLPLGLSCFPSSLKVLHWRGCPLKTLPLTNQLDEVVDIDLCGSNIKQLWQGKQFMEKLKYLDLTKSVNLKRFPDISGAPNLEKLILKGCTSLTKVHPSLVHHKKIVLLNLENCKSLESLPGKLEMSSLKILDISGCYKLCRLVDGLKELKCLEELHANNIAFEELPSDIFHLNNIKVLSLSNVLSSRTGFRFPPPVWSLPSLRYLNLSGCNLSEESIPDYFWQLPSLVSLDLSRNNFVSIPSNISELPMLKFLALNRCYLLKLLPELPSSIIHLDATHCYSLEISKFNPAKPCSLFAFESIMEGDCLPTARFDMFIPGNEIPSWFVPQRTVSRAKIQVPNNCPVDEWVGLSLCFILKDNYLSELEIDCCLLTPNGEKLVSTRRLPSALLLLRYSHLYILYLSIDQLRDKICEDDCWSDIEFTLRYPRNYSNGSEKCGSRLVCKKDVEDWNKQVRPLKKSKR